MSIDFRAAMRRATAATRALDVGEATRLIRQALAGGAEPAPDPEPQPEPESPPKRRRTVRAVEDAEVVDPAAAPPRRPLRDVVRDLSAGRATPFAQPLQRRTAAEPPLPPGAAFETRSFTCAAGSRGYRLYVPASAHAGVRGLVVMLHGCTQSPEDFAAGTGMNAVAEAHGLLVAYPAQTAVHNPNACWNWFRPEDQRRGAGEPAILAGLAEAVATEFAVPRDRIFVAGLSAGGAMAAVMAETYPELFAAAGVHSGLPFAAATDVASAFAAMRGTPRTAANAAGPASRLIVFHGTADATVSPANAAALAARAGLAASGPDRSAEPAAPGRRGFSRTVLRRPDGTRAVELWMIDGAGHAWSGGNPSGSYTDAEGPDASAEMVRFFLQG